MDESLKMALIKLGYETWPSQYPNKKRLIKDGKLIDIMSVHEMWAYLGINHPEFFDDKSYV